MHLTSAPRSLYPRVSCDCNTLLSTPSNSQMLRPDESATIFQTSATCAQASRSTEARHTTADQTGFTSGPARSLFSGDQSRQYPIRTMLWVEPLRCCALVTSRTSGLLVTNLRPLTTSSAAIWMHVPQYTPATKNEAVILIKAVDQAKVAV